MQRSRNQDRLLELLAMRTAFLRGMPQAPAASGSTMAVAQTQGELRYEGQVEALARKREVEALVPMICTAGNADSLLQTGRTKIVIRKFSRL